MAKEKITDFAKFERICPICGKTFVCTVPEEWVYRKSNVFMCSYHCWRAYKVHKPKRKGRQPTLYLEINGERKTISEWAKISGLKHRVIYQRAQVLGWTGAACLAAVNSKPTKIRERAREEI